MIDDEEVNKYMMTECKPTWQNVCEAYLRSFARCRHSETSRDLMPRDERITKALRSLYRHSDKHDRAVMRGQFEGTRKAQKSRFNRLCVLLAVKAGLTAFAIVPELEENGNPDTGESEEL